MQILPMPKNEEKPHHRNRRAVSYMSPEDVKSGKKSKWEDLEISGPIRNLSPSLWHLTHLRSLFLNDNQLSRIPPEIKHLQCLRILDLSNNKLRSLPAELGDLVKLQELHLNQNCLRSLPYELGKLFQLQCLGLTGNPLSPDILAMHSKGTYRLLTFFLDNLPVSAPEPPQREWIKTNEPEHVQYPASLSVMSYNILCDKYATRQMYGYCPPWSLNWEYRRKIIMSEILSYAADIISLQEVETCEFSNFFEPELKRHGYDGVFSPKSRAKHMCEDDKQHVDGCAIFWKTCKFQLVKEHLIEFNQIAMKNNHGSEDMLNRVTTKDNIGLAVQLQTLDGLYSNNMGGFVPAEQKQTILAATAHMHWDPEFSDVKLIQTVMLCYELKLICDEISQNRNRATGGSTSPDPLSVPLVMCGDLNSLPDSGVVEYLSTGRVSTSHNDFRELKYSKCLSEFSQELRDNVGKHDPNNITHPFNFKSAYDLYDKPLLEYSNNTYEFTGVIDYIFHSQDHLLQLGILGGVDCDWFRDNNIIGFPHPHIPSDHIPLVAEFQLLPPGYQIQNGYSQSQMYLPNGMTNGYHHRMSMQPYNRSSPINNVASTMNSMNINGRR